MLARYPKDQEYARMEREAGRIAEAAIYHALRLVNAPDRDEMAEIIVAKYLQGVSPARIAAQLEIPFRDVWRVTSKLPIDDGLSLNRLIAIVGKSEFTAARLADELCVELPEIRNRLRALESAGKVAKVGRVKVGRQMCVVWRVV